LLGFQKGALKQVDVHEGTWKVFGVWSREKTINEEYYLEPHHPSVSLMDVQKVFGENERDKDNQHGVELALLSFDC
jgi:hypothetical protein